ncbi:MAG: response regulator transcription factor [Campylobacterota bacterium]
MKILLLEDDLVLNEIIEEHLQEQGHSITTVFDGNSAQELIYSKLYDLLLLDVNVPNIDGFELLEDIRQKQIKTPAIYITSANMLQDMEKGFNIGCDDYIKKPFELRELDLRIKNIKRLRNISTEDIIDISNSMTLDMENSILYKDKKQIHLPQKECEVLFYLIKNSHRHISMQELSLNIWSYEDSPLDSTIRTYIKNLRKILGEDIISNIRGVGYRFNKK